jgi:hypothetical protein
MTVAINSQLQAELDAFKASVLNNPAGTAAYTELMNSINTDQVLLTNLNANALSGSLGGFKWVDSGNGATGGGAVQTGGAAANPVDTIEIGATYFTNSLSSVYDMDDFIGHEDYHVGYASSLYGLLGGWNTSVTNYFNGTATTGVTANSLFQQGESLNNGNEGGAYITGFNSAASAYMAANNLTTLTANDVKNLMLVDGYTSYAFNADGTLKAGNGIALDSSGLIDFSQSLAGATTMMGGLTASLGATGNNYFEYYGASELSTFCADAHGAPIQLNFAQDGLLTNASGTLTDQQVDQMMITTDSLPGFTPLVGPNTLACTIQDTGDNKTTIFDYLAPGASGNGLPASSTIQFNVTPTTPAANGSSTDFLEDDATSGATVYTDTTTNSSTGAVTSSITGTGDVDSVSNATVTVAAAGEATVVGNQDSITSGTGDTTVVQGNSDTIRDGGGDITTVIGNGDTTTLLANSGSSLGVTGLTDVVNSVDNTIALDGANTSATVVGGSDTIDMTAGSQTLTLSKADDTVHVANSLTGDVVDGTSQTVDAGSADNFTVDGKTDTVNAASDTLQVAGASSTVTVDGASDAVDLSAASQTVTLAVAGDTVHVANSLSGDVVDGTSQTVDAGSADNFTVDGKTDTVNAASDTLQVAGASSTVTVDGASNTIDMTAAGQSLNLGSNGDVVNALANDNGEHVTGNDETLNTNGGSFTLDGAGFTVNENHSSAYTTTDWLEANTSANIDGVNQATTSSDLESLQYNGSAEETALTQFSSLSGWELNDTNYNPTTGFAQNQTIFGNIQNGVDLETQYNEYNAQGNAIQQDNYGTNGYLSEVETSTGSTAYFTTGYVTDGNSADGFFKNIDSFNGTTGAETQLNAYNATTGALQDVDFFNGGNYADEEEFTSGANPYFAQVNQYNTSTGAILQGSFYNAANGGLEQTDLFNGGAYADEEEFATAGDGYFNQIQVFNSSNGAEEYSDIYNPTTGAFESQTDYNGYTGGGTSDGSDSGYDDGDDDDDGDDGTGSFGGDDGGDGGGDDAIMKTTNGIAAGSNKASGSNNGLFAASGQLEQAIGVADSGSILGGSSAFSDPFSSASPATQAAIAVSAGSSSARAVPSVSVHSPSQGGETNPAHLPDPWNVQMLIHAMSAFGHDRGEASYIAPGTSAFEEHHLALAS